MTEQKTVARLPVLDTFIDESLVRIQNSLPVATAAMSPDECDELFRQMLKNCWGL